MEPRDLTYEEGLALLFPQLDPAERTKVTLPKNWVVWKKPGGKAALPELDDAIEKIFGDRREELETRGVSCPYYTVRFAIAVAIARAQLAIDFKKQRRDQIARLQRLNDQLDDIDRFFFDQESATRFAIADIAPIYERGILYADDQATNAAQRRAKSALTQLREATDALRDLAGIELQRQPVPGNNVDENLLWKEAFVQQLGVMWRGLTGNDPPTMHVGHFVDFVSIAYATLGGGELATSVIVKAISQIKGRGGKSPIAAAAQGQGFDRYD